MKSRFFQILFISFFCILISLTSAWYIMTGGFSKNSATTPNNKICLNNPSSIGCYVCQNDEVGQNIQLCTQCNKEADSLIDTSKVGIRPAYELHTLIETGNIVNNINEISEIVCSQDVVEIKI